MKYDSTGYEADIWQGVVVITDKVGGKCGCIAFQGRSAAAMLGQDVKKHGAEKALAVWAKLVTAWE